MMNAQSDAHQVMNQMAKGLRRMVDEAEGLVKQAADTGDAKLEAARDTMQKQLQVMRRQLEGFEEDMARSIKHAAQAADENIHDHPYAAMGLAGLIGVVAGLALARR